MIRKARTVRDAKAEPTPQGGSIPVEIKVRDLGPELGGDIDTFTVHMHRETLCDRWNNTIESGQVSAPTSEQRKTNNN